MGVPAMNESHAMTMTSGSPCNPRKIAGFSLLELMVAMTLGLLLAVGIISLFAGTSRTNKIQDALAHLQENGRFAVTRVESDLRALGAQYCSNKSGAAASAATINVWPGRAPMVYAASLPLPDAAGMRSVDATGTPSTSVATTPYALSPRFFMQGYDCSPGTCTPSLPSSGGAADILPAEALAINSRVPKTDVLTIRYQRGTGWPLDVTPPAADCTKLPTSIKLLSPAGAAGATTDGNGNDLLNFNAGGGQLALISDCQNTSIIPITAFGGSALSVTAAGFLAGGTPICSNPGDRDMRVFNFSKDFVTVSYYLAFSADTNPDATTNSPAPKRLIPSLMRKENGNAAQEVVQGVDRMDLRYAVQDNAGATHYLTASQVNDRKGGTIPCPPKPDGIPPTAAAAEPGCLWRAVGAVEVHLLLNTVNNLPDLDPTSRSYRYALDNLPAPGTRSDLPSGLQPGAMMRREFISLVSVRNYNP
jgi:type IV pilus assembly protein PilW